MLQIGVMLPRSNMFPAIGIDILAGIRSCLKKAGLTNEVKIASANIGFGLDDAEIYSKAEKFILEDDVDILLVVADAPISEMVAPLCVSANKLLIMVNFGANFPDNWQPADTVIQHSLNFSFLTRLTGQLAAKEANCKQTPYIVSYMDAGYRQCFSLMHGHQLAGGEACFTHVTHTSRDPFTLQALEEYLDAHPGTDAVLALFAGDMAAEFYDAMVGIGTKTPLTVYAGPMLLDSSVKQNEGVTLQMPDVKGYSSWIPELTNENNLSFTGQVKNDTGKSASIFHVLGWDTGLLLDAILQQYAKGVTDPRSIITALAEKIYPSPRGWMKLDPATQYTYSSNWLVELKGDREIQAITENKQVEEDWKSFTSDPFPPGDHSYWRNTYLCI